MKLKELNRIGINEEAIKMQDTPEFPKATARDARNDQAYKSRTVDRVVQAFYSDASNLLDNLDQLQANIDSLQAEKQTMLDQMDQLQSDLGQSHLVDQKIEEFESMMDTMEIKLREAVQARERMLNYKDSVEALKEEAARSAELEKEIQSLQEKLQVANQTIDDQKGQLETQKGQLDQQTEQLQLFDEGYYQLERDINDIVMNFRQQLANLGIQFEQGVQPTNDIDHADGEMVSHPTLEDDIELPEDLAIESE